MGTIFIWDEIYACIVHTYLDIISRHQIEFLNIRKLYLEKVKQKLTIELIYDISPNIYCMTKASSKITEHVVLSYTF